MLKQNGYSIVTNPAARPIENDLERCAHCGMVMLMKPGHGTPYVMVYRSETEVYEKEATRCSRCWQFKCPKAACNGPDCVPYEKKLDLEERAARANIGNFECL